MIENGVKYGMMNGVKGHPLGPSFAVAAAGLHRRPLAHHANLEGTGTQILRQEKVSKMRLLTSNPVKRTGLGDYSIKVTEMEP